MAWTAQPSGTTKYLLDVWGADANNVWAAGIDGVILKWDGAAWEAQTSGSTDYFYGLWGTGANRVWAIGGKGTILKWNGIAWVP